MIKGIHHVSLKCADQKTYEEVRRFYCDILGLRVKRVWDEGMMLDTGNGLIEVFDNGAGVRELGAVRHFALAADHIDDLADRIGKAGYEVFIQPKDIVIHSDPALPARIAFCRGPLGEEIELFDEK